MGSGVASGGSGTGMAGRCESPPPLTGIDGVAAAVSWMYFLGLVGPLHSRQALFSSLDAGVPAVIEPVDGLLALPAASRIQMR